MTRFKIVFQFLNSSIKQLVSGLFKRSLNAKALDGASPNLISNLENDSIHRTLENIEAYRSHVIPSPRSCLKLIHYQNSHSNIEKCNCTQHCKLSEKPLSASVVSKTDYAIDVKGIFSNKSLHFKNKEFQEKTCSSIKDSAFEIQNLSSLHSPNTDSEMVNNLKVKLQNTSDMELAEVMTYSSLLPFQDQTNFAHLMKALDSECCKRYLNWTTEQQLFVADIWFHLHTGKFCGYNLHVVSKMSKSLFDLTTCQLIHLLFIINLRRKVNPEVMQKIEKILEVKLNSLSLEEMAVIAMAYFKTSTKICSDVIISAMINCVNKSLPDRNLVVLTAIVKTLRYSYRFENEEKVLALLNKALEHHIWKTNFPVAMHLCLLSHSHNVYVPKLLDTVISDICRFENVRLKDLSRVLLVASKFNHLSLSTHSHVYDFFQKEFESPERKEEIEMYPHPYMSSLLCFAYAGIFIRRELNKVFSKRFYKVLETRVAHDFLRDLATLDYIAEIDAPDYLGNRLDVKNRFEVFKERRKQAEEKKSFRKHVTLDLSRLLRDILGQEVPTIHLLPYMDDPVFLVILSNDGQLCKPSDDFINLVSRGHFARPTNQHNWIVIWPLMKTDLRCSMHGLSGFSSVKERHFVKLGFKVIKVPIDVHNNLAKSRTFLLESLKCYLKNPRCDVNTVK